MRKFANFLGPKLEKYQEEETVEPQPKPVVPKYVPRDLRDFIGVIQRTPKSVLSDKDRERIAAIMSFEERCVGDLMAPREKIVFVKKDEVLGPLVLDRLYKSGFTNFPVVDGTGKVVGVIHTEALNALEIRKADKAEKYMDKAVNYLMVADGLKHAVEEIERTNSYYFLVNDKNGVLVGCFTIQMLLDYLIGRD